MSVTQLRTVPKITRTEVGMQFPVVVAFEDWAEEARKLQDEHKSQLWQIGDAFVYGIERFGELASAIVGNYSAETIQRAMRLCKVFPYQRRRNVGFSLHQACEKLPPNEQDELLAAAEKGDWTREAMRESVREKREAREAAEAAKQPKLATEKTEPAPESNASPCAPAAEGSAAPEPLRPTPGTLADIDEDEAIERLGDDHHDDDEAGDEVLDEAATERAEAHEVIPPDPLPPLSADDAVAMLRALAGNTLPANIAQAVTVLLEEREKFLRLMRSVKIACELGMLTPTLRDVYQSLVAPD